MQHLVRRARLDQPPGIEHRHRIAQPVDDAEIMADQQHGEIAPRPEFVEQRQDLRLDRDVERRGGFVEQQQVRLRSRSAVAMPTRCFMPPESWCG